MEHICFNDEDEDGNFAKWMSSYWSHGASEEQTKGRRRSLRQLRLLHADRRASLPCQVGLQGVCVCVPAGVF
uniref:Uncharacterized protein n=1 Tax=Paramormyrops kingsleyae TaxID=1676925 RepID=A0A3B3SVD5_9TELE